MRGLWTCYTLSLLIGVAGCLSQTAPSAPSSELVQNTDYHVVIGFDLRDDAAPKCGLFLNEKSPSNVSATGRNILLPFPTDSAESNRALISTWASIKNCCTVLTYFQQPSVSGRYTIGLTPSFSPQPSDPSALPGQLYFLRLGQERVFIYRYHFPPGNEDLEKLTSGQTLGTADAIAIARPTNAKGSEVRGNKTEYPERIHANEAAVFYPAVSPDAGTDHLEIRYELPLTSSQELLVKFLVELLAAGIPPLIVLLFVDLKGPAKKRVRTFSLAVLIPTEVGVIIYIGYLAWHARTSQTIEALLSGVALLIGLLFSLVVAYLKKGSSQPQEV